MVADYHIDAPGVYENYEIVIHKRSDVAEFLDKYKEALYAVVDQYEDDE